MRSRDLEIRFTSVMSPSFIITDDHLEGNCERR
jgi:hypothetical protein